MTLPGGPDPSTLRAWLSAERALEEGQPVDDAVAFLRDVAVGAFGPEVLGRLGAFLGEDGELGALLDDDDRLAALLAALQAPDDEPDDEPAAHALVWSASSPRDTRQRMRRAAGLQRRAVAMLQPRRTDVAGERSRRQRG